MNSRAGPGAAQRHQQVVVEAIAAEHDRAGRCRAAQAAYAQRRRVRPLDGQHRGATRHVIPHDPHLLSVEPLRVRESDRLLHGKAEGVKALHHDREVPEAIDLPIQAVRPRNAATPTTAIASPATVRRRTNPRTARVSGYGVGPARDPAVDAGIRHRDGIGRGGRVRGAQWLSGRRLGTGRQRERTDAHSYERGQALSPTNESDVAPHRRRRRWSKRDLRSGRSQTSNGARTIVEATRPQ